MAPIRVGFIGLSSTQSWAVFAHLPYFRDTQTYEIVALCNSTVESAQAAIKTHSLASTTKAYGSPEDLAADSDVDLVVCSIRVDKHYAALKPAIQAGKDVFCEWPLAKDAAEAEELLTLAKEKGVKTFVGMQAHQSRALKKIRQIMLDGKIGKPLSTNFYATPKFFGPSGWEGLAYQEDRSIGGNMLTIYTMHALESIQKVLSPISTYNAVLGIKNPEVQLTNFTGEPTTKVVRTSHDQILLQGSLSCGMIFSYHMRGGPAFKKTEGSVWRIYGTKGEIQVTGEDSYLQISDDNLKIEVFDHASGEVETVVVDEKDAFSKLPLYAKNIARLYEAYANGTGEEGGVLDWEAAVKRHRFVDEVYQKAGVH